MLYKKLLETTNINSFSIETPFSDSLNFLYSSIPINTNTMKKLFFLVINIALSFFIYAQIPITFDKSINGEIGGKIIEKPAYYTILLNAYSSDFERLVLDKNGNQLDVQTYGGNSYEFVYNGLRTRDGGYIIIGSSYSFNILNDVRNPFVVKIDSQGMLQWQNTYRYEGYSGNLSAFYSGDTTADKGYIFAGDACCDSLKSSGDWYRRAMYIVKSDSVGNEEWNIMDSTLSPDLGFWQDISVKTSPLHDGYYIASHLVDTIINMGGSDWQYADKFVLIKTDLQGNYEWIRRYEPTIYDIREYYSFLEIYPTDHNTLILLGTWLLMEVDLAGNELWRKERLWGFTPGTIAKVPWGGYILSAGEYLYHINDYGDIIWSRQYNDIASFWDIIPTQDGGYLALAHAPGGRLIKMDCEGNVLNPVACTPVSIASNAPEIAFEVIETEEGWQMDALSSYDVLASVKLYDLTGRLINLYPFRNQSVVIPRTHLSKGLYLLQLIDNNGQVVKGIKLINP